MILDAPSRFRSVSIPIILHPQKQITTSLKDTAQFERPRDLASGCEEPEHLHCVTSYPASKDRDSEALARPRLVVGIYLGKRERGFHRESNVSDNRWVCHIYGRHRGEEEFADDEANEEIEEELPVSAREAVSVCQ
jgi:hypothetical protein